MYAELNEGEGGLDIRTGVLFQVLHLLSPPLLAPNAFITWFPLQISTVIQCQLAAWPRFKQVTLNPIMVNIVNIDKVEN